MAATNPTTAERDADEFLTTYDKREALIRMAQRGDVVAQMDNITGKHRITERQEAFEARKLAREL